MKSILSTGRQLPLHDHNPGWFYHQPMFSLSSSLHIPKAILGAMSNINRTYLLGALLTMTMLSACSNDKNTAPPPSPPKVVAVPVLQQTVPIVMQFPGTVKGNRKVVIKPQISGYIEQRLFTEGSQVKAGDVLYQIDPRPFQTQLHAAEAQLKQNQASLSFWTLEVERYNQLLKNNYVSKERRDSAVTKKKEFAAAADKDKADIEQAKLDLGYTRIVAPFAGWIQETQVYKGAVVTAQQTELTTVTSLNPVYVDFYISRREAYTIQELSVSGLGPQKRSDMTGLLTLPDGSIYSQQGHVDYSSASFNPDTDTMAARAIFTNTSIDHKHISGLALTLIPGQYALLNLTVGKLPDALLIPQAALLETQQGSFVYVLAKDNKVAKRMVTKGASYEQYWVIKKGLKKGETVISEGLQKIKKSGMQVQPVKPTELKETKKADA